jgi:hypothetical protein
LNYKSPSALCKDRLIDKANGRPEFALLDLKSSRKPDDARETSVFRRRPLAQFVREKLFHGVASGLLGNL